MECATGNLDPPPIGFIDDPSNYKFIGGVFPVILGSLFITMMSNAMNLLRIDGYIQQILLGVVIIAAIFLDRIRSTRA